MELASSAVHGGTKVSGHPVHTGVYIPQQYEFFQDKISSGEGFQVGFHALLTRIIIKVVNAL